MARKYTITKSLYGQATRRNPGSRMGLGTSILLGSVSALGGLPGIGVGTIIMAVTKSKKTIPFIVSGLVTFGLLVTTGLVLKGALKDLEK